MEKLSDKKPCNICTNKRCQDDPYRCLSPSCFRCSRRDTWLAQCVDKLAKYETVEKQGRLFIMPEVTESGYREALEETVEQIVWDRDALMAILFNYDMFVRGANNGGKGVPFWCQCCCREADEYDSDR